MCQGERKLLTTWTSTWPPSVDARLSASAHAAVTSGDLVPTLTASLGPAMRMRWTQRDLPALEGLSRACQAPPTAPKMGSSTSELPSYCFTTHLASVARSSVRFSSAARQGPLSAAALASGQPHHFYLPLPGLLALADAAVVLPGGLELPAHSYCLASASPLLLDMLTVVRSQPELLSSAAQASG